MGCVTKHVLPKRRSKREEKCLPVLAAYAITLTVNLLSTTSDGSRFSIRGAMEGPRNPTEGQLPSFAETENA